MIPLDLATIAGLVDGELVDGADRACVVRNEVVIDSRRVQADDLFVCVRGDHVDGHDFAAAAVSAGAVAALAERRVDAPAVLVGDVAQALGRLAAGALERSAARVVGVTGSSGKTSTKDLLAAVFAAAGETVAPENSFNNEIGLPLTVLRVSDTTETLVLEYSARGPGHIRYLCGIARPQTAVVLNVGAAHLGEFGSRDAIAVAKGELVEELAPDGVAVLNADDPRVAAMSSRTRATVVTFGSRPDADVHVSDVTVDALARPSFELHTPHGSSRVQLLLHGRHHALNAAAAAAAAVSAGVPYDAVVDALSRATSRSPHRMDLRTRADGLIVIDDAYNANPDSMRAAMTALSRVAGGRRAWAVLGPMRELGEESDRMHDEVGRAAAEAGVAELVTVGADAERIATSAAAVDGWHGRTRTVADAPAAATLVAAEARPDDVVLVKASNSERLWRVADALLGAGVEVSA